MKAKFTFALTVFLSLSQLAFGQLERRSFEVSSFHSIDIGGAFTIHLRRGLEPEVVAMAEPDQLDDLSVSVDRGELHVEMDNSLWFWGKSEEIRLYITVTDLDQIEISGATSLTGANTLDATELSILCQGASEVDLKIDVTRLSVECNGASEVTLSGIARSAEIECNGASELSAIELQVERMKLEASGACQAEVYVTEDLEVEAHGASDVRYTGNPTVTKDVSTASSVSKSN